MDKFELYKMVLEAIALPLVVLILAKIQAYITERIKEIKPEKVRKAVLHLWETVDLSVRATAQTFVNDMKEAGTFDKAAHEEAFKKAKQMALDTLKPETEKLIKESVGDINEFIEMLIEASVQAQKEE